MSIQENYLLSSLTTFQIGGKADFFVEIRNQSDLVAALEFAHKKTIPIFVLGGGSNILISDEGYRGLVIRNKLSTLTIEDSGEITVGAGEVWDEVVTAAVKKNLAGIECLSGIPGSAGGAVVQNIGAYGQTLSDVVTEVTAVSLESGEEKIFTPTDCKFEYRGSWFKKNPGKYIVTKFKIHLNREAKPTITYPDVLKNFAGNPNPTLSEVREVIVQIRASKGYVIMADYESYKTAGSFFKNPVIEESQFEKLQPLFGDEGLNRFWKTPKGIKLAAAFLMQEAGFPKGYQEGEVGISPKHSLSIVNFGNATASEVKELAEKIKSVVFSKFGVELEEEVLYV